MILPLPVDIATRVMTTLRGAPMLIALLLINASVMVMLTYLILETGEYRHKRETELLAALERCYVGKPK